MAHFTFTNKLSGAQRFELGAVPQLEYVTDAAILPVTVVLESCIGSETALVWVDKTDFIYQCARVRPFNLMLKTGVVRTSHGPLMFLLFWLPSPAMPNRPFASIDLHINPFDLVHLAPLHDLARQSHWHVILVDADSCVVDLFEFENVYDLAESLELVSTAVSDMSHDSFDKAKAEFCQDYTMEELFVL